MSVVVTGATGFLGNNLVRRLNDKGVRPVCLRRPGILPPAVENLDAEWDDTSLGNSGRLRKRLAGAEILYHCAARTGTARLVSDHFVAANVELTERLVTAALGTAVRFIHCSTIATCAVSGNRTAVDENAPWNLDRFHMTDAYTTTKKLAEERVLAAVQRGLDAVVVNPTFMFGPYDLKPGSCQIILDVVDRKLPGYPPGSNNFVDVRDVAAGLEAAAARGRRGHRYILGGENLSFRELFARISTIAGTRAIDRPLPLWLVKGIAGLGDLKERLTGRESLLNSCGLAWMTADCRFSSEKAMRELNYQPTDVDRAIDDALRWLRRPARNSPRQK